MPKPLWPRFSAKRSGAYESGFGIPAPEHSKGNFGGNLKAFISFLKSTDGKVAVLAFVLLAIVSHFSDPYNAWINLLARIGNIVVFLYILWRAGGKKFVQSLKGRGTAVTQELLSLEKRRAEAEEALASLQKRIGNLEAERQAILEESRSAAEKMRELILQKAHADAEAVIMQARKAGENEIAAEKKKIREQLADEITAAVEESLRSRLDAAGHAKLIDNALKKVVLN